MLFKFCWFDEGNCFLRNQFQDLDLERAVFNGQYQKGEIIEKKPLLL